MNIKPILVFYIFPMVWSFGFYTSKFIKDYKDDLKDRQDLIDKGRGDWYSPNLYVKDIVSFLVANLIPIFNWIIFVATFEKPLSYVWKKWKKFLDIPLVPIPKYSTISRRMRK